VSKSGLVSPRAAVRPALSDLGERSALIGRQRVGRVSRRPQQSGRGWGGRLALIGGAVAVLGLQSAGVAWLLTTPRFAVRGVEVRGASRVPAERILAAAAIAPGTNLWRIDPSAVVGRVQALPQIRRAELIRELPRRVVLVVEERRPFTLVHGARLHWLDEEGRVLGEESRAVVSPAPVITGLSEAEVAHTRTEPSAKTRVAIALIRVLLRSGSPLASDIAEIDMSRREGPVLYTEDGIEVRLGAEDWGERLGRLEGVLAQVARQGGAVSAIDLRFRDQIILTTGGQG
jgi:cell division protein FtsQ